MTIDQMKTAAVRRAKDRMGAGWPLLGQELQEALIAREALVIISQNEDNPGYERAAALAGLVLSDQ